MGKLENSNTQCGFVSKAFRVGKLSSAQKLVQFYGLSIINSILLSTLPENKFCSNEIYHPFIQIIHVNLPSHLVLPDFESGLDSWFDYKI